MTGGAAVFPVRTNASNQGRFEDAFGDFSAGVIASALRGQLLLI